MSASCHVNVKVALEESYLTTQERFNDSANPARELINIIESVIGGHLSGKVIVHVDQANGSTAASEDITFDSSAGADGDTISVAGIVFTARTSPSVRADDGEFLLYADDDTNQAVAFKNAVLRHPKARHLVTASNASEVATVTAVEKGTMMNLIALVSSNASFAALGSAALNGGTASTKAVDVTVCDDANCLE